MRNKRQIEDKSIKKKERRLDEPEQGAFVFAHKVDMFNKYLVGTPRRPFHQPRKYFILLVTQVEEGWKKTGAIFLERLWKSYGIIHAMLIAPCSKTGESVKFLVIHDQTYYHRAFAFHRLLDSMILFI